MCLWALVMPRTGGGEVGRYWNEMVKAWFGSNPQLFLELLYAGVDFQGDPNMGLPLDYAWGPTCMIFYVFFI